MATVEGFVIYRVVKESHLKNVTSEEGPEGHAETSYQDSKGKDFQVEGTASAKTKVEICWAYV